MLLKVCFAVLSVAALSACASSNNAAGADPYAHLPSCNMARMGVGLGMEQGGVILCREEPTFPKKRDKELEKAAVGALLNFQSAK